MENTTKQTLQNMSRLRPAQVLAVGRVEGSAPTTPIAGLTLSLPFDLFEMFRQQKGTAAFAIKFLPLADVADALVVMTVQCAGTQLRISAVARDQSLQACFRLAIFCKSFALRLTSWPDINQDVLEEVLSFELEDCTVAELQATASVRAVTDSDLFPLVHMALEQQDQAAGVSLIEGEAVGDVISFVLTTPPGQFLYAMAEIANAVISGNSTRSRTGGTTG